MDALYLLDPDVKSRTKLLSNHDITGSPCAVSTALSVTTQNDNSQVTVDLYLAEYTETIPGRYLQPGWIGSVNVSHNKTITYGDVKKLIYNSTELEVMRYLKPCNFYIYKNDWIKIRDLLIKQRTLDEFNKMNDSDIVDPSNAIIMHYMGSLIGSYEFNSYPYDNLWTQQDLEQISLRTNGDIPLPKDWEAEVLQSVLVLLVSMGATETTAARIFLQPLNGHKKIYRFSQAGQATYFIGKYGVSPAAIRDLPLDFELHGSANTVIMMAERCFPNLGGVISVGVAYGMRGEVKLCDVIVSSKVVNYDKAVDRDGGYLQRGEAIDLSPQLVKLFTQPVQWPNDNIKKRLIDSGVPTPIVKSGMILSGPYLLNDPAMEKTLSRDLLHKVIGIEMNKAYLFEANQQTTIDTIIVKSVCDFGDWNNIKVYQPTAALLAANLVQKCLSDHQAAKMLKGKILLRQMLQQAKNEGLTINVRHAKIVLCGAAKAGKTSFSRLLRNKEHETLYKSTPAGDGHHVLISGKENGFSTKVNVVGTSWISLDSKLETQQVTNRLIQRLRKNELMVHSNPSATPDLPISVDNVQPYNQTATKSAGVSDASVAYSELNDSVPENQSLASASEGKLSGLFDSEVGYCVGNELTNQCIGIEEHMLTYTDNVNAPVSELENIPETWDLFTLLDTGGQPAFINMLPAINGSTAITFVVLNMSKGKKCLENTVVCQYECEGYDIDKRDSKCYTNLDLLKCLLFSIKFSAMKQNFDPQIVAKVKEDEHPESVVCIIGTCADVLKNEFGEKYDEELSEINKEVKNVVNIITENEKGKTDKDKMEFWCKHNSESYVTPVDNTISRKPQMENFNHEMAEEIQRIRERSNEILRKKAQYEIPISWFILELELRNQDKVCIPLKEVKDICDRIMPSHRKMKIHQIKEVLKFYHLYGMLLYFSEVKSMEDFVITNPQWLFINLTKILMCKFAKDLIYESRLIEEINKGICSMESLRRLNLNLQGVALESFVELLVDLKVVAPVKTIENAYFIPSVLPQYDDESDLCIEEECGELAAYTVDGQCICKKVEPLLIQFTFGSIPRGLFGFLIVQLLQDDPDTYELHGETEYILCPYADLICFYIKPCWYIFLRDRIFYLELQVRVIGEEPSYHYKIQTAVTNALKKLCYEFDWPFSDCRYGFLCDKHSQYPRGKHLTLLPTNPPYTDDIPKYACCKWQPTPLSEAHKIWFKDIHKISKSPDDKTRVPSEPTAATTTSPSIGIQSSEKNHQVPSSPTLDQKPQMGCLVKFVIPKVKAYWEDVAYGVLNYDISVVQAIKRNHQNDVKGCCQELFEDWLTTEHGIKPKTWSTLLSQLGEVDDLKCITEMIKEKLSQLPCL